MSHQVECQIFLPSLNIEEGKLAWVCSITMWEEVKGWRSSREIVTCCDRPSTATEAPNQSPAFTTLALLFQEQ